MARPAFPPPLKFRAHLLTVFQELVVIRHQFVEPGLEAIVFLGTLGQVRFAGENVIIALGLRVLLCGKKLFGKTRRYLGTRPIELLRR